jgi:hypothetical protein
MAIRLSALRISHDLLPRNINFLLLELILLQVEYTQGTCAEMNKDIQKVWRYPALQWHNVITQHPENQ